MTNFIECHACDVDRTVHTEAHSSVRSNKVLTGNQALPRQGTIHDLAKAMMFLCSDEAGYITGQNMLVDGGANMI